jgi:hypothetical protein
MKKRTLLVSLSFVILIAIVAIGIRTLPPISSADEITFLAPEAAAVPNEGIGEFIPGGRNVEAYRYVHSAGYPPFLDRAKFLGTFTGSWYRMGKQFGARSGDLTRCVSDIWWRDSCIMWGKPETLRAMDLYEAQIAALDPNQIEFMQGIADGAGPWLSQSIYAHPSHELYASNYQRVLAVNIWDEWSMIHPSEFPDGSSTYGGTQTGPPVTCCSHSCSAFAATGAATSDGRTISAQNRQTPHDPRCYQEVYIIKPPKGNAAWILTNCPQVAANQVVNDKGLSVSLLFGGVSNPQSWDYEGELYCAEGFGVPWFNLFLYVGTHADTAEEAIEILTVGTPKYRARTGRNSLLRGGGWIFLVADEDTMAVVEATADRYAVRYPGEFTGPEWDSTDYIVSTNHFLCDFSYDKNNNLTDIPMTIFNVYPGHSELRFWTLMWDMEHRYGRIDKYMAQHIMSGLYGHDEVTGEKIDCALSAGECYLFGELYACNQGSGVGFVGGSNDCKIAVADGKNSQVYWTLGNASDWEGSWDEYNFKKRASRPARR